MNVLEVTGANKQYRGFALRDISFSLEAGYVSGLIGPNGSGKSTLIKAILGLIRLDAGNVRLFGQSYDGDERGIKRRVGFVFDEHPFYDHLRIADMKRIFASFYPQWNEPQYRLYLERFELPERRRIRDLSKGMKLKLSLAFALSHDAELIVMDEPTSGLDPIFRYDLLQMLRDLMKEERRTVLFSTHNTNDLDRIADYVTFLYRGRMLYSGSLDDWLGRHAMVKGPAKLLDHDVRRLFVGLRETPYGFEGLAADRAEAERLFAGLATIERPTLDEVMVYSVRKGDLP
ncbi:MAG: ABC transporter ATP-binding protein [Paenibacillaceae bacterium]|nr:ABC transporter ATP-binding protein [Paenibacillaceae bacterium]